MNMIKEENKGLVSVIIPNYNHSRYLKERIESVLNQTYENFEIIILDDCSTDNSVEIIEQYRENNKVRSVIINDVNSGSTFKQWQKGFMYATGEYIWIAESDDIAHPDFLKTIIDRMSEDENIVLGFSSMYRIDENGNNQGVINLTTRGGKHIMRGEDFIRNNMLFGCHILNASSAIFRRKALQRVSPEYTDYVGSGDYLFWIEIARQGNVVKVNQPLDYFRNHSNKVTPRVVATGIQFEEVHRIVEHIYSLGYCTKLKKTIIAGFWLRKIRKCKIFKNNSIKERSWRIWANDTINPYLSITAYYIYGLGRYIVKKII